MQPPSYPPQQPRRRNRPQRSLADRLASPKVILALVGIAFLSFAAAIVVWLSQGEAPPNHTDLN